MSSTDASPAAPPVTVIIPAYNEAGAVGDVVAGLIARYPDYEIIVVNDGSSDDTGQLAEAAGARVIRHDWNKGYGAALRTGIRAAHGVAVCFFDADGQHEAEDVGRLVAELDTYDMVVGARTQDSHAPVARRPGKLVLRAFADAMLGTKVPDVNSGLRAFKRDVILRYLHLMPSGFSFSTTSTFAMVKSGRPIKWVPITAKARIGTSSVSQIRHGFQTLMLMLRLTTLFEPLKVFLPVSFLLVAVAIIHLAATWQTGIGVTDTTVFLGVSGVIVFMMGLVIDQVAAIRREKHE